jgi:hypothetical protein
MWHTSSCRWSQIISVMKLRSHTLYTASSHTSYPYTTALGPSSADTCPICPFYSSSPPPRDTPKAIGLVPVPIPSSNPPTSLDITKPFASSRRLYPQLLQLPGTRSSMPLLLTVSHLASLAIASLPGSCLHCLPPLCPFYAPICL